MGNLEPVPDGDVAAAAVARASQLWSMGEPRAARELLKETVRATPQLTAPRRALAELYRETGCPDQAGRWGISIPGWTTPLERDRLARLLASSSVAWDDVGEFLALPDADTVAELRVLLDGPVESYRHQFGIDALPRSGGGGYLVGMVVLAWLATVLVGLIGAVVIIGLALVRFADPQQSARLVGACVLLAGAFALTTTSIAFAVGRERWIAAVFGACAVGCGSIAGNLLISG